MSKNLKIFKESSNWLSTSVDSIKLLRTMGSEPSIPLESISGIVSPETLDELKGSHSSKSRYKAVLHNGNVVCAKIRGNSVELMTQNGASPDMLPKIAHNPKEIVRSMTGKRTGSIAGSFVAQAVELDDTEYYKDGISINGYFGKGCYLSQKPPVNVKESFKDRVRREDKTKGVAFFQIKPGTNIITPSDDRFGEVRENMHKDFFTQYIKSKGVDGVVDPDNNIVVIFNRDKLDYVASSTLPDVKRMMDKNIESSMTM